MVDLTHAAAMAVRDVLREEIDASGRGAQANLARALGVKPQTITKWLKGETTIPPRWWLAIEEFLEIDKFSLAKEAGLFDSLGLGDVSLTDALSRWEALFPGSRPESLPLRVEDEIGERVVSPVEAAINADPDLTRPKKRALVRAYQDAVRSNRRDRRANGK